MKIKFISNIKDNNYKSLFIDNNLILDNLIKNSLCLEIDKYEKLYFTISDLKYYFLIIKGTIRISKIYNNGTKFTFIFLKEYDLFGKFGEIKKKNSSFIYELEALENTFLLKISIFGIFNKMRHDKTLYKKLIFALNKRLIRNNMLMEILTHRNIKNRLISFLLYLALYFGSLSKLGIIINLNLSHSTIAEILCSTRVTITRHIQSLEKMQYIKYLKKNIIIINPILLTQYKNL
ncbi:ntcA-like transcriptional regulator (chloroplast) [Galdieria partita]|uniref:NtcA-like transcriptional regulator n=1 Tax=Galdieria partita TaxID=83374 RepID=A0A9C7BKU3_9RHOD|nr:ntcA-like transcriptional regulator [Galdieria partita]